MIKIQINVFLAEAVFILSTITAGLPNHSWHSNKIIGTLTTKH
jgi:hypothetical protein